MHQISFLLLSIFNSYVSSIQNKIFVGTLMRILNLTNSVVASWDFSCLLSPGLYGSVFLSLVNNIETYLSVALVLKKFVLSLDVLNY